MNEFIKAEIIKAADLAIPVYKNNVNNVKNLPQYILNLIKLRKTARKQSQKKGLHDEEKKAYKARFNKLTQIIRGEMLAINNNKWAEFISKLGSHPPSQKPFWQRINKIRGKKVNQKIPTLLVNDIRK